MAISIDEVTFKHPIPSQLLLIHNWFKKPHVSKFFDDPEAGRSLPDLRNYLEVRIIFGHLGWSITIKFLLPIS